MKIDSAEQARLQDSLRIAQLRLDSISAVRDSISRVRVHEEKINFVLNLSKNTNIKDKFDVEDFLKAIDKAAANIREEKDQVTRKKMYNALVACQKKNFPIARKVFAKAMKDELWRSDIKVLYSGGTSIEFIASDFIRNANIEDSYKVIKSKMYDLRFTKVSFRWYEGSEGTYYNTRAPKDDFISGVIM